MPIEPDATMIAIDRAFDDGRESLADDLQDFISNYDEEGGIPVQDIEEFLDLMLGYEPPDPVDDAFIDAELEARLSHDY